MPPIEPNRIKLAYNFDKMQNSGLDPKVIEYCRAHCINTVERLYASMKVAPEAYTNHFATIGINYNELITQLAGKIPDDLRKRLDNPSQRKQHGTGLILEDG